MLEFNKIYNYFYSLKKYCISIFEKLFGFVFVKIYLGLFLIGSFLLWIGVYYINKNVSQNLVILHYNVDFGVDLIGDVKRIFVIPILSLIIFFVNSFLVLVFLHHKDFKFLSHLLLASTLVVNIFLLASLFSVYLINFR